MYIALRRTVEHREGGGGGGGGGGVLCVKETSTMLKIAEMV